LQAVSQAQLDIVQLHGSEPAQWAHHIPVPVIRVFHIGNGRGADGITRGGDHQFVLLDSLRDDGSGVSGGSGKTVDWDFAKGVVAAGEILETDKSGTKMKFPLPIILAGGLTPENVASAIGRVRPWAVDVSGGVETLDGDAKDLEKVRAFIQAAKKK